MSKIKVSIKPARGGHSNFTFSYEVKGETDDR